MKKIIDDATIYFIALYVYNSFCNWTSKQPCLLLCVSDFYKLKKYSHRKVTRCAHDYAAGNPEPGPGVPWGLVQHSSHSQGKQLVPRTLADRRLKQEGSEGLQVQSLASGFQDSQLPPLLALLYSLDAFQIQYLNENFLLLIPCLVSLSLS